MGLSERERGEEPKKHDRREVLALHTKTKKVHANTIVSGVLTRRFALQRVNTPLTGSPTLFRAKRPSIDSNNRPLP